MSVMQHNSTAPRPGSGAASGAGTRSSQDDGSRAGGLRSGAGTGSPQGTPHRSWGLVSLAVLLVVGTGLAVATWGFTAGHKESVLAVVGPVAKGHVIEREDLVATSVSGVAGTVAVDDAASVIGQTATVDLVAGQLLVRGTYANAAVPGKGEASVGLALDPSRAPGAGLEPGDAVDVFAVGRSEEAGKGVDSPTTLASDAQVYAVDGEASAGGQLLVTIIVPASSAARITAYSTQNRVAIVETSPGEGR